MLPRTTRTRRSTSRGVLALGGRSSGMKSMSSPTPSGV